MTTKFKIIGGFLIMMVLVGIMAVAGYRSISTASHYFNEYERLAELNVYFSDIVADLNLQAFNLEQFRVTYDPKDATEAVNDVARAIATGNKAMPLLRTNEHRTALQQALNDMGRYKPFIEAVRDNTTAARKKYEEYNNIMVEFRHELTVISDISVRAGNITLLRQLMDMWDAVALARVNIGRHSEAMDHKLAETAYSALEDAKKVLAHVGTLLVTSEGRREYEKLIALEKRFEDAFHQQDELALKAEAAINETVKLDESITTVVRNLSNTINDQMHEYQEATHKNNDAAQNQMLIMSVVGLLLGAGIATALILGLIKVLNKLAAYATAIAGGDFDAESGIKEKGEIGRLTESLTSIPTTLKSVMQEYETLENGVETGQLDIQGRVSAFSGGFAKLMQGTNAILTRFRTIIDNIPSPVVVLNKDLVANYLNNVAQTLAGSDYKGKTCFELMAREDFNGPTCSLKKAVESGQQSTSETIAHPQGATLDITYTAIPMLDSNGKLASVLQLITDLTAIKNTQRTIMRVASQALEISDRVAAASEELSAQVEQVSRGAELQRERVDSTASAMNEMNSTVLEVARNAGQASEQSDSTREHAEGGQGIVNKVVTAMNSVNDVSMRLQKNMEDLGQQAENVGGVMNVISDIADQTNLLALNAAIEAARAGEAGRGFAVVADEVRKLAEKTMSATQEVGNNISAIQSSTKTNITEVGQAVESIAQATELANSSGEALKGIVQLASETSSLVTSIATAAEEQSKTSEEITRSIDEISQIVGETAEGMIQSSSAVQELARLAQNLNTVMAQLKDGENAEEEPAPEAPKVKATEEKATAAPAEKAPAEKAPAASESGDQAAE